MPLTTQPTDEKTAQQLSALAGPPEDPGLIPRLTGDPQLQRQFQGIEGPFLASEGTKCTHIFRQILIHIK